MRLAAPAKVDGHGPEARLGQGLGLLPPARLVEAAPVSQHDPAAARAVHVRMDDTAVRGGKGDRDGRRGRRRERHRQQKRGQTRHVGSLRGLAPRHFGRRLALAFALGFGLALARARVLGLGRARALALGLT